MFEVAQQTLDQIDNHLARDDGAAFRIALKRAVAELDDAFRGADEYPFRAHLGASLIGRPCSRALWYGFRWASKIKFIPRILRLFNRGHLEEARFVALLRQAQITVEPTDQDGKQYRVKGVDGHFGSALDSLLLGVPEYPTEWMVGEYKTHGEKSFLKLQAEGVKESKPEHYAQCQACMERTGTKKTLYLAVNKNTDDLYAEILHYNDAHARMLVHERAPSIIYADSVPSRIPMASPGNFVCKYCDHSKICFGKVAPVLNCRTCRFSSPGPEGTWRCGNERGRGISEAPLDMAEQVAGCGDYRPKPDFV
jgi:hypothetical protein